MVLLICRLFAFLLTLTAISAASFAEEAEIWSENINPAWLDENVAAATRANRPRRPTRLNRLQVWASGVARSDLHAFLPTDFDRAVGAKMQPFQDYNFLVGTELVRGGGETSVLSSKASWEALLKRDWERLGVSVGLTTAGSVDSIRNGYSQSIGGTMDIPLDLSLHTWSTELRFSPSMNLDSLSGDIGTALLSEIVGQTRLNSPTDRFRSELNVRLGYGLAQNTRPVASAKLELRIAPNL